MSSLGWRVGVELELMAPRGRTRRDLAVALAGPGGRVQRFFHPQSEPSLVPDMKVFDSLTLGFRAVDADGREVARCVDDLTLQAGLERTAPPRPGWYRIVSDDRRLLHLVRRVGDAELDVFDALAPTAALFGTAVERAPGGLVRVSDEIGSPVALGARLPGERERPCEVVSPPIAPDADLGSVLEHLLSTARSLGFSVPTEAATHLHFESTPLESAPAFANLVEHLATWGDALKAVLRTNPRCVRLGPIPSPLLDVVRAEDFRSLPWPAARERLKTTRPSKYVDWNVKNLVHPRADKPTFEVRVLPGTLVSPPVVRAAHLFAALLRLSVGGPPAAPCAPRSQLAPLLDQLVEQAALDPAVARALGSS